MPDVANLLLYIVVLAIWGAALGGGGYLYVRVVRALRAVEARRGDGVGSEALQARVAALEAQLERVERSVERVDDGQQFTAQLLASRQRPPAE